MSAEPAESDGRVWWRYAVEDLEQADLLHADEHGSPRWVCALSQQAAEKALKAALVFLGTDFPRTHDLVRLKLLLPTEWKVVTGDVDLTSLRRWAVRSRYPADWPEPTETMQRSLSHRARHHRPRPGGSRSRAVSAGVADTTPPADNDRPDVDTCDDHTLQND